jgi:hypothetical protein
MTGCHRRRIIERSPEFFDVVNKSVVAHAE